MCNFVPLVRRDRLWQSYLVFGILSAAHILLVLFTHWSVDVKCAVAFRACSDMQQATHCKVKSGRAFVTDYEPAHGLADKNREGYVNSVPSCFFSNLFSTCAA